MSKAPILAWFVRPRLQEWSYAPTEDLPHILEALVAMEIVNGPFALDEDDWN